MSGIVFPVTQHNVPEDLSLQHVLRFKFGGIRWGVIHMAIRMDILSSIPMYVWYIHDMNGYV
jgi:hypothetical protein